MKKNRGVTSSAKYGSNVQGEWGRWLISMHGTIEEAQERADEFRPKGQAAKGFRPEGPVYVTCGQKVVRTRIDGVWTK